MLHTWAIHDNERWTVVLNSLAERLNSVNIVGSKIKLADISVTIAHADKSKILLVGGLTTSSETSNGTHWSSLRLLTTSIGVNFGIENHDGEVHTRSHDVVETTIANIIGPTITTLDDDDGTSKQISSIRRTKVLGDFTVRALHGLKDVYNGVTSKLRFFKLVGGIEPLLHGSLEVIGSALLGNDLLAGLLQLLAALVKSADHTETELSVVLEERVSPSGTLALVVGAVWVVWEAETIDG